jgi:hypothetical protein
VCVAIIMNSLRWIPRRLINSNGQKLWTMYCSSPSNLYLPKKYKEPNIVMSPYVLLLLHKISEQPLISVPTCGFLSSHAHWLWIPPEHPSQLLIIIILLSLCKSTLPLQSHGQGTETLISSIECNVRLHI